ncbi:MAG: hypothetical protein G01um101416_1049 [Microgenomates group bacterium Gr01-1014_16]|nr:MAG: hypothetical protein G01um101416_1049 [Microgenomates group bacterium Gr01-1014_16]
MRLFQKLGKQVPEDMLHNQRLVDTLIYEKDFHYKLGTLETLATGLLGLSIIPDILSSDFSWTVLKIYLLSAYVLSAADNFFKVKLLKSKISRQAQTP